MSKENIKKQIYIGTIIFYIYIFFYNRKTLLKTNSGKTKTTKWVFWVNITKSEVNLRYRYCSKLFGILRRQIEFRYYRCRNSTKSMREKKKKVERENVEFRQRWYRIFSAQFCCLCMECPKWKGEKTILTNELWQCHCRNRGINLFFSNCGNGIVENGGKKSYEIYERVKKKSCHVYNIFTTFSQ